MATIFIGADHNGFEHKQFLIEQLRKDGHTVTDMGPTALDPEDDYPDFAIPVAQHVARAEGVGIFICGSGNGPCMISNKVHGVRAGVARAVDDAVGIRNHQDANLLCMGASSTSQELALDIARAFLSSTFSGGRHQRRIDKMMGLEQ